MELLQKLGEIQNKYKYLPEEELSALSDETGFSVGDIISRASFYSFLTFDPDPADHIESLYPCRKAGRLLSPASLYEWKGLKNAKQAPQQIIPEIEAAGLLGRSGGGFPVAKKWGITKEARGDVKYVVCNADEGELFTGKDRVLLEKNPCSVIEGMAICAEAIGAENGFIYLRREYADLCGLLKESIAKAPLKNFEIKVCMGHGAYVCGDETALLNSLEGKRGETRLKPPYPGVSGYMGCPTIVNNVESFANVSYILANGSEKFRQEGSVDYPGTKLFTVSGAVKDPGVYELASGLTLKELAEAAGGVTEPLNAILIGGGSCMLSGPDCMNTVMTPAGCRSAGLSFGTGAVRFIGRNENLLSFVRELSEFFTRESCGICVPCRIGLRRITEILLKAESGKAWPEDIEKLSELTEHIRANARCPLGQAAVTPIQSLIDRFPEVLLCQ